jgi:sulfide:quinone oxidoreductase
MAKITYLTPSLATASQLEAKDFAQIAKMGFKSVISNRPDAEEGVLISSKDARKESREAGLKYAYVPASNHDLFDEDLLDTFEKALCQMPGPILVYCRSGTRSSILWAMVAARHIAVDVVLRVLADAGLDLAFLEDELTEQSERSFPDRAAPATVQSGKLVDCGRVREHALAAAG